MKRSIARKWAKALESGEYKQTRGKLRRGDAFCCLGILCNLHAQEHPEIAAEETSDYSYLGEIGVAPAKVMEWSGMQDSCGCTNTALYKDSFGELHGSLAGLNDEAKLTFPEIAKVIRKHWKEL